MPRPLSVGDRVVLEATSDPTRAHLIGREATVVSVQANNPVVLGAVRFDDEPGRFTMVAGLDQVRPTGSTRHHVQLGRRR